MEIDSGVVLPPSNHRGGFYKYPWESMKIGDSFLILDKTIQHMSSIANRASTRLGCKFSCRSMDGGVRVFRVS